MCPESSPSETASKVITATNQPSVSNKTQWPHTPVTFYRVRATAEGIKTETRRSTGNVYTFWKQLEVWGVIQAEEDVFHPSKYSLLTCLVQKMEVGGPLHCLCVPASGFIWWNGRNKTIKTKALNVIYGGRRQEDGVYDQWSSTDVNSLLKLF